MSINISYPYDNPSNYSYDDDLIEVTGGTAKLKLQQDDIDFTEDFADDTGFTYNTLLSQFTGGRVEQIDQRPVNSVIASKFISTLDANFAADGVSLLHTVNGSPSLSSGKLLCDYTVNSGQNGIYYSDVAIGNLSGNWVAKFKYTPGYSTTPPENINIFSITPNIPSATNRIAIFNSPSGNNIRITANGLSAVTFDTWEPIADQEYVFEIFCVSNQISIYIDGVQLGTAKTINPAQGTDAVRVYLGASPAIYNKASAKYDEFIFYSTTSQTTSYTIPNATYLENNIILPEMEHTGDGTIKLFNSLTLVYTGSPRILLEIGRSGNKLYWNGLAWVTSNETYAQANSLTDFNNNCSTLPVNGEKYGQFTLVFPDTNIKNSVDTLTANLNADIGYITTNPTIRPTAGQKMDGLINWVETVTKTGTDDIKRLIKLNNDIYYLNNGVWTVTLTEDYNLAMSISEILAEKDSLLTEGFGKVFLPISFLRSGDGTSTPILSNDTITYDFSGEDYTLTENIVYSNNLLINGNAKIEYLTVRPINNIYGDKTTIRKLATPVTIQSNGYWEAKLYIEDEEPDYLLWSFDGYKVKTNFVAGIVKFSDLTIIREG